MTDTENRKWDQVSRDSWRIQ